MSFKTYKQKLALLVILSIILPILIFAIPVLAAYQTTITVVTNSSFTTTDMISLLATVDIDYMKTNGYMTSTGLDTRVKYSGSTVPFMLDEDLIAFANPITASSSTDFSFTTGNSLLSNFDIVIGDGGYITTSDNAGLEVGSDLFSFILDGYFNTASATGDTPIFAKDSAIELYVEATDGTISVDLNGLTELTATGITSGEHEIELRRSISDYNLTVEYPMVTYEWQAIGGSGVGSTDYDYYSFSGGAFDLDDADIDEPIPCDGTISDLYMVDTNTPVTGTKTATLYLNGSPTSLTCSVTGSETSASDTTHTVDISAGDTVYIEVEDDGTSDAGENDSEIFKVFSTFTPDNADESFFHGITGTTLANDTTRYAPIEEAGLGFSTTEYPSVMTTSGTLSDFYVNLETAPISGYWQFTIMKNGVATDLNVICNTAGVHSDTTHSASYVAGDTISIKCFPNGTLTNCAMMYGLRNTTSTDGYRTLNSHDDCDDTATEYARIAQIGNALYYNHILLKGNHVASLSDFYVELESAAGSGKSYTFTVYKNGSPTSITVTISDTNTTGNDTTHSTTVEDGDFLWIVITPSGTPDTEPRANFGIGLTDIGTERVELYIDSVYKDGVDFTDAITNNANDWIFYWTDAIEYLEYFDYEIDSVNTIHYQPVSIIYNDTLINEDSSGTYDGAITWGNMSSITGLVSTTVSSLEITEDPLPPDAGSGEGSAEANVHINVDTDDMLGETGQPNWTGGQSSALLTNPLHPLMNIVPTITGGAIPLSLTWIMFAILCVICAILGVAKVIPNHLILMLIAGFIIIIVFTAMTVFPWWVIFVYTVCGVTLVLYERVPAV